MPFVITAACIDVKDRSCVDECPVDCIYEGGRMRYINPSECIDCGACVPACPVDAIYMDYDLPDEMQDFARINKEFFEPSITGWGNPGGAYRVEPSDLDHEAVQRFLNPSA